MRNCWISRLDKASQLQGPMSEDPTPRSRSLRWASLYPTSLPLLSKSQSAVGSSRLCPSCGLVRYSRWAGPGRILGVFWEKQSLSWINIMWFEASLVFHLASVCLWSKWQWPLVLASRSWGHLSTLSRRKRICFLLVSGSDWEWKSVAVVVKFDTARHSLLSQAMPYTAWVGQWLGKRVA